MDILPAIDLKQDEGGRARCVRLEQGCAEKVSAYSDDPAAVARRWRECGATWLHVVDLDGAFLGRPVNTEAVGEVVRAGGVNVQAGGGIRDDESAALLLDGIGVTRIVVGTRALADPGWARALCARHPGRIVGGVDARDGAVSVEGWTRGTTVQATDAARRLAECGVAAIVFTDIATDGMLRGPNVGATEVMVRAVPVPVIASGGVASIEDVRRLAELPLWGIIIGRALYTGAVDLRAALQVAAEPRVGRVQEL